MGKKVKVMGKKVKETKAKKARKGEVSGTVRVRNLTKVPEMPPLALISVTDGQIQITADKHLGEALGKLEGLSASLLLPKPDNEAANSEVPEVDCRYISLFGNVDDLVAKDKKGGVNELHSIYRQTIIDPVAEGCRQVWGRDEMQPEWFPEDIQFQHPTHRTKDPSGKTCSTVTAADMRKAIKAFQCHCLQAINEGKRPIRVVEFDWPKIKEIQSDQGEQSKGLKGVAPMTVTSNSETEPDAE